jgi:hypothetical protein
MRIRIIALAVICGLAACASEAPAGARADDAAADGPAALDATLAVPDARDAPGLPPIADAGASHEVGPDEPVDLLQGFLGDWTISAEQRQLNCPGMAPITAPFMGGRMRFLRGIDAPLVIEANCPLRFDVAGQAAILRAGQVCPPTNGTFSDRTAYTETDTFNSGSFVVNGPVATLALSASAQIVFGQTLVCTLGVTGTLHKITP